jgi:tetratricopeptide (TPR) repeat protein
MKVGLRGAGSNPGSDERQSPSSYASAIDSAIAEASEQSSNLDHERAAASLLCEELLDHPPLRRLTLVTNSRRFQSWGLSEHLIQRSFDCRFEHPTRGVELAELAVAATESLDPDTYGHRAVNDQLGRAWAYLGNAHRVLSDLREAEKAFAEAKRWFAEGSEDPLDRALWLRFHSHLLTTRSQFEAARSQQNQAIEIYWRCGELSQATMLMSDQAVGILYSGDPEGALPRFEQTLEMAQARGDDRYVALAIHNIAHCLSDLERYAEALERIERSRPVLESFGDTLSVARSIWLEAKVEIGRGNYDVAEEALIRVRDSFIDEGIGYDAALSSLELATIYAEQGRSGELRQLASEMRPIFRSHDVHREALAALIVFRQAVEEETLTLALLQSILGYLQAARNKPEMRFRPEL